MEELFISKEAEELYKSIVKEILEEVIENKLMEILEEKKIAESRSIKVRKEFDEWMKGCRNDYIEYKHKN